MYKTGTKCCLPNCFFYEKIPDGFSLSKRLLNWCVFFIRWTFDDWCYMYYSGRIKMNWNIDINFTFMLKIVLYKTVVEWFSSFKKTHVRYLLFSMRYINIIIIIRYLNCCFLRKIIGTHFIVNKKELWTIYVKLI